MFKSHLFCVSLLKGLLRFAPGLIMMQFTTIFFPLWEAYESRYHRKLTIAALDEWEKKRSAAKSVGGDTLKQSSSISQIEKQERRDMYSMQSLERTLSQDAMPLLQFAATKEFTGENIIFLTQVRDWKRAWNQARDASGTVKPEAQRTLYNRAAELFFSNVCLLTAQFPVNIESKVYVALERTFRQEMPLAIKKSVITPFADDVHLIDGSTSSVHAPAFELGRQDEEAVSLAETATANIPRGFDGTAFDSAEASVKYMVLTNTWAR